MPEQDAELDTQEESVEAPQSSVDGLEAQIETKLEDMDEGKDLLTPDAVPQEVIDAFEKYEKGESGDDPDLAEDKEADVDTGDSVDEEVDEGDEESQSQEEDSGTFDPALLLKAGKLGIPEEDVLACGNDGALGALVNAMEKNGATLDGPAEQDVEAVEHKFERLELDPEEYDEEVIELVNKFNDKIEEQFNQLAEQNTAMLTNLQEIDTQNYISSFESEIGSLGEKWHGVFGKGPIDDMAKNSETYNNRMALFDQVNELKDLYVAKGKDSSLNELVGKASAILFQDQMNELARKEIHANVKKRSKQTIARPSSAKKSGAEKTAEEEGYQKYITNMAEKGVEVSATPNEVFAGLPD